MIEFVVLLSLFVGLVFAAIYNKWYWDKMGAFALFLDDRFNRHVYGPILTMILIVTFLAPPMLTTILIAYLTGNYNVYD